MSITPASIVSELVDFISSNNLGTPGTDLFIGHFIPNPDNVTMVFPAGGGIQDMYLDTQNAVIDVWTRNTDTLVAYDKLLAVYNLLHRQQNILLSRFYVYFCFASTNILDMDRDSQGRKLFKLTFNVIYRDTNSVS